MCACVCVCSELFFQVTAELTWGELHLLRFIIIIVASVWGCTHLLHVRRNILHLLKRWLVRWQHGEHGPEPSGHRAQLHRFSHRRAACCRWATVYLCRCPAQTESSARCVTRLFFCFDPEGTLSGSLMKPGTEMSRGGKFCPAGNRAGVNPPQQQDRVTVTTHLNALLRLSEGGFTLTARIHEVSRAVSLDLARVRFTACCSACRASWHPQSGHPSVHMINTHTTWSIFTQHDQYPHSQLCVWRSRAVQRREALSRAAARI